MDKKSLFFLFILTASLFLVNYFFFPATAPPATTTSQTAVVKEESILGKTTEKLREQTGTFYVLENAYQQLVFSTEGAALAEINLKLQNAKNPQSLVKPIRFDRDIVTYYPANAYFPNYSYYGVDEEGKIVKKKPTMGGYTPLLRRDLKNPQGLPDFVISPEFYALNVFQLDHKGSPSTFQVKEMTSRSITFESTGGKRKITKTFSFPEEDAPYAIDVAMRIEGDSSHFWLTSGICEVELISGNYNPILQYYFLKGQSTKVEKISLPKETVRYSSIAPLWLSNSNGFFGTILDPLSSSVAGFQASQIPGVTIPSRLTLIDAKYDRYPAKNYPGYTLLLPYKPTSDTLRFRLYAGPYEDAVLKQVSTAFTSPTTGGNPHYSSAISYHGWFSFISEPFAKFLFILIQFFYRITRSWGASIILLTLTLRFMLYPLNAWSIKSMHRMQLISPKIAHIQSKHKKDPKRAQIEVMQLYKEEKVNPFSGCLPLIIQMPFLIGMFDLLKSTFQLRGATFIPGWINNLAAPDILFSWNYPVVFFGTSFHLLPFLLGLAMFLQQKFNQWIQGTKKAPLTDQQRQQQSMGTIMTVVFTVMFYHFPSGLNLYWLFSTLFGMLQQYYIVRRLKNPTSSLTVSSN